VSSWKEGTVGALIESLKRHDPDAVVGVAQWSGTNLGLDACWFDTTTPEGAAPKLYDTKRPGTISCVVLLTPGDLSLWEGLKNGDGVSKRTQQEWLADAESWAMKHLNTSADEAWDRVRAGEFGGTAFAAELKQLMFLAGRD